MRAGIDAAWTAVLRTSLASGALLLAGGVALAAATDGFQAFTTETARRVAVRRQPADLPAVALENQSGARFTLADLRGKWLLVDFIYTRCPSFCTVLGGDFAQLERQLAGPIAQGRVQLLSISFDPTQDPPAELAAYLRRFRGRDMGGWQAARPLTGCGRSPRRSASPSSGIGSAGTRTTPRFTSWIPRVAWWTSSTWATWTS